MLAARQTLIAELSSNFGTQLTSWNLPWVASADSAVIDSETYLPIVTGSLSRVSKHPAETLYVG